LELKFVSLVWALEAMSRNENEILKDKKLSEKISRILNCARALNAGDRRWLKERLDHAREPSLCDRLFHLLRTLPVEFDENGLKKFAKSCADLRNDLSHFVGLNPNKWKHKTYGDLVRELINLTPALDLLCRIKILKIIGVSDDLIQKSVIQKEESEFHLQNAGVVLPAPPMPDLPSPQGDAPT
ncbi:MAG: HEPN domain-containing protein, partial [Acidibrevibacterium sp.]|uniref:HEPN domain-containing protein n=1 Tax=Acidibrevibacterium sp. TaxID=2606776 RepID=UPI003D095122